MRLRSSLATLLHRTMSSTSSDLDIAYNLRGILSRVSAAHDAADAQTRSPQPPRLVAVSKTKPRELVLAAYAAGQRHFGENYIQELYDKSHDAEVRERCPDIRWHFIGTCQSNKAAKVVKSANVAVVETVTSVKLADVLQRACAKEAKTLRVFVQVNTSGEENNGGVAPGEAPKLARHIKDNCSNLELAGLMTIGALGHSLAKEHEAGANPDFILLRKCRDEVSSELGVKNTDLELSMGMSNDFEEAIRMGSTNVRVGSSIFGARDYGQKKKEGDDGKGLEEKVQELKIEEKK